MFNPTHKLFLDDSGNKDYAPDKVYNFRGGRSPYFVFGGLLLTPKAAGELVYKFRGMKIKYFGTFRIEIKAHWLRRPNEREKRYLKPFSLSSEELGRFVDEMYDLIIASDLLLLACVIDKKAMAEKYMIPHHPAGVAYDFVLQRAQREMNLQGGRVGVTIDEMRGSTAAGNEHKVLLHRQHKRLLRFGTPLQSSFTFDRVMNLDFRDSADSELLQLSDLVAYAVYRQFVDHGPDWGDRSKALPLYDYLARLIPKFRCGPRGRVQGYGIVKYPDDDKIHWNNKVQE